MPTMLTEGDHVRGRAPRATDAPSWLCCAEDPRTFVVCDLPPWPHAVHSGLQPYWPNSGRSESSHWTTGGTTEWRRVTFTDAAERVAVAGGQPVPFTGWPG